MLYAFDGTWSHDCSSPHQWTNVCRLAKACHPGQVEYYAGTGNPLECKGLSAGRSVDHTAGAATILDDALRDFATHWRAGHRTVDVIGFSRGAIIALAFLNKLRDWSRHRGDREVRLRFVGLFDAVDAIGAPDHDWDFWYEKSLPVGVEAAVHAVAIHETRATYPVHDVRGAVQQAFPGAHCDIGGGWSATGLSDATLEWMYRAAERAGVEFLVPLADLQLKPDPAMLPHRALDERCRHRPRTLPEGTLMPASYLWPILREETPARGRMRPPNFKRGPLGWSFLDDAAFHQPSPLDLEEDLIVIDDESDDAKQRRRGDSARLARGAAK